MQPTRAGFPQSGQAVIVDISTGAKDLEGGLGAILTQMDDHGRFSVILLIATR